MNILLWIIQLLLSLLFMFAGVMKFIMPVADMQKGSPVVFPGWFFHFIGVCEILGGLGLILPALLRIKPGLTPLAATGLGIITLGAAIITAQMAFRWPYSLSSCACFHSSLPLAAGVWRQCRRNEPDCPKRMTSQISRPSFTMLMAVITLAIGSTFAQRQTQSDRALLLQPDTLR